MTGRALFGVNVARLGEYIAIGTSCGVKDM